MSRIAVLFDQEGTQVLTDTAGVPVLIVDRNIREAEGTVMVDGERAVVRALFSGIPQFAPDRVAQIFGELASCLPQAQPCEAASLPRTVILIERGAAPEVLTADGALAVAVVHRAPVPGPDPVLVEGRPAVRASVTTGLPQVAPRYVDAVFDEVRSQLDQVFAIPVLSDKKRMQLINVARAWFGVELL